MKIKIKICKLIDKQKQDVVLIKFSLSTAVIYAEGIVLTKNIFFNFRQQKMARVEKC